MKTYFFFVIVFLLIGSQLSFSQGNNLQQNLGTKNKIQAETVIFNDVESSILTNDIKLISKYFSPQPYISLVNGVNGYYSANQTYYILEDFLSNYRVVSFKIAETKTEGTISHGRGDYFFEKKGKREVAHLYVTLTKSGNKWQITQISIN